MGDNRSGSSQPNGEDPETPQNADDDKGGSTPDEGGSDDPDAPKSSEPFERDSPDDEAIYLAGIEIARIWLKRLDTRDGMFDNKLFGDRNWEMMMQVYCAEHDGHDLKVTGLVPAAPTNSSSRRSIILESIGLVVRADHPVDKRRLIVGLTDEGRRLVREYLDKLVRSGS